ncbi:MAG TPA: TRZ/ATZ family protein [Acholeplasmataceae bacterium]|jgi:fumarate hydratase subunit beta|nr:TRZ/ATZ family protein [Acholeplasmataceae bacterium]
MKKLNLPLSEQEILSLQSGDGVLLSGVIYTARDAAHKRILEDLDAGRTLPFPLTGSVIYYVGPTPAKPGEAIGSAGPTSSYRMDRQAMVLLELGARISIGKGDRSPEFKEKLKECRGLYLAAIGGAGALISQSIKSCELIAYPDLGPEAVHRLVVEDFPVIVAYDAWGGDIFESGRSRYRKG